MFIIIHCLRQQTIVFFFTLTIGLYLLELKYILNVLFYVRYFTLLTHKVKLEKLNINQLLGKTKCSNSAILNTLR